MDEAERCHRLAILDRGRLVAEGTPEALRAALAGRTLVVDSAQPRQARGRLLALAGIQGVAQVGTELRVLARDGEGLETRVAAALREAGISARVRPAPANLEDVFVAATQGRTAEAA